MNLNKFNFYKNSVYFLIANAVLAIISLIIGLIFGVNYNTSIPAGNLLFSCVMACLLSTIAIFLFVGFTTNFAKAFSIVLIIANNILLSTALIILLRLPVSESILMGFILLIAITTLFALLSTQKLNNVKKEDKNEIIKNSLQDNSKLVFVTSVIIVAVLLLGLIVASQSMFDLVRIFLVMIAVIVYSYLTIQLPVACYMLTKIGVRKKAKIDKKVKNQKVVKAVSVDDEIIEDGAVIEQNDEDNQNI